MIERKQRRRIAAVLGYAVLAAALPVAMMGLMSANEFKAWGGGGIDCDGPGLVLFFGALGLAIYGAGALLNGRHFRKPARLLPASACRSASR